MIEMADFEEKSAVASLTQQKYELDEPFEGLDKLDLLESRAVEDYKPTQLSSMHKSGGKKRRIKEIENQKKFIADELRKLDQEIDQIKGKAQQDNSYKKREKIQRNEGAAKQAEQLVKDLKMQRKELELKRKNEQ